MSHFKKEQLVETTCTKTGAVLQVIDFPQTQSAVVASKPALEIPTLINTGRGTKALFLLG